MKRRIVSVLIAASCFISLSACGNATQKETESANENESISVYIGGTIFEESMDPVKGFMMC